jgi:PHP family Zn ribbon phosphoesterase
MFEMEKPDYFAIKRALEEKDSKVFTGTIEVDPGYGKYHYDGHSACKVSLSPAETKKHKGMCPVCGKPLTIGVENRVEELADRPAGYVLGGAPKYLKIIPLHEVVAGVQGVGVASKKVSHVAGMLISSFGSELNVLLKAPEKALAELSNASLASAIMKNRRGEIEVKPGYDGEYGVPIFEDSPERDKKLPASQKTMFDY